MASSNGEQCRAVPLRSRSSQPLAWPLSRCSRVRSAWWCARNPPADRVDRRMQRGNGEHRGGRAKRSGCGGGGGGAAVAAGPIGAGRERLYTPEMWFCSRVRRCTVLRDGCYRRRRAPNRQQSPDAVGAGAIAVATAAASVRTATSVTGPTILCCLVRWRGLSPERKRQGSPLGIPHV